MSEYALEMLEITKTFSKVTALDKVNIRVKPGEIHALIGENGAGKSTLMKVLSGVYKPDGGEIKINGETVHIHNPKDAIKKGVTIIYQELSLVPELNAIQNVMLGQEISTCKLIQSKEENSFATKFLDYVSRGSIDSYKIPVRHLSVAQQQMVDIAKALSYHSKIIIMDEPTDSLTSSEIDILFQCVRKLKEDGVTVIYISHRLEELIELCDRVTVLRDGKYIIDADIKDISKEWLISKMIGRDLKDTFPPRHRVHSEEIALEAVELTGERFENISFQLRKGEILGMTGLVGAGRTEVLRAIFGADKRKSGKVKIFGEEVTISHPSKALKCGLGFVTEDRKVQGLFLNQSIEKNITMAALSKVSMQGFINKPKEDKMARDYFENLKVAAPNTKKLCKYLSGGNQQKVVLAKWLASGCKILFLDEPTRGIDVGAKYEIYALMDQLVQNGVSIIMISSEMPEVMGVSDRVLVMHEGGLTGEIMEEDFSEGRIMEMASGEKMA